MAREIGTSTNSPPLVPGAEDLAAENARLRAALEERDSKPVTIKVSAKGAVSVYGLGRFPTTLYAGQWEKLLAHKDEILAFIEEHEGSLSRK